MFLHLSAKRGDPGSGAPGTNQQQNGRKETPRAPVTEQGNGSRHGMTVARKATVGLAGLLLIIAGLVALGYKNSADFSQNTTDYNRLAFFNVGLSNLRAELYSSAYNVALYYLTHDPQNFEQAREAGARAIKHINSVGNYANDAADRETLAELSKNIELLRAALLNMERSSTSSWAMVTSLNQEADEISTNLDNMIKAAKTNENHDLVYALSEINRYLFNTHLSILKYAQERSPQVRDAVTDNMRECTTHISSLAPLLKTPSENHLYASLNSSASLYFSDVRKIQNDSVESALSLTLARNLFTQLLDSTVLLNDSVDKRMFEFAHDLHSNNASAQSRVLAVGAFGLALGLALAMIIVMSITRVLSEVSEFAQQLAAGNFNARIRVREKGKIGLLINSLQRIPEILRSVQAHTDKLATEVNLGYFRKRLDEKPFSGSFSDIVASINKVCDSYVLTLDTIPSPLFTCDTDLTILFTNDAGRELAARAPVNVKCHEFFGGKACNASECCGAQALCKDGTYSGEETIFPCGNKMNVQITTRSIKDSAGNIVGFLGRILDLTEIRRREFVMFSVAAKAMVIVERLAEAASRISDQVEHIAAGAEEQRKRIHYTAVAMSQMNNSILEVAQNAEVAARRTENTYACASKSSFLINQAAAEIMALHAVNANMDSSLQTLENHSGAIVSAAAEISGIAVQAEKLNLAAAWRRRELSALSQEPGNLSTVESLAAQPSENFTAITKTIRGLVEENMGNARSMENAVTLVQASLHAHVQEVDEVMLRVETLSSLAVTMERSLQEIVSLATDSAKVVSAIAAAAEEQSNTAIEISPVMDSINTIAAEAAQNAASVADSVQNLAHITKDLREIMRTLK